MSGRLILLALVSGAVAACGPDDPGYCDADVTVTFSTVGEGEDVIDVTIRDVRLERLAGDVQGYREGTTASLLLYGAALRLTPPCGAREVEVVLDQTQVGLTASLYEAGSDLPFHTAGSQTAADLEPDQGSYQRWTLTWPGDASARRLVLGNTDSTGVSTLIRAVVFR
jgi:hypothetical protein